LRNFAKCFPSADLDEKRRILGSTFPERMIFENGKCRTPEKENILLLIAAPGAGFGKKRKSGKDESLPLSRQVEPLGVEPRSKHMPDKLSTCLFRY